MTFREQYASEFLNALRRALPADLPEHHRPPLLEAFHTDTVVPQDVIAGPSSFLWRRFRDTLSKAQQAQLPVKYLGYGPLFSEPQLISGRQRNWVVMPVEVDPMFHRYGRFYAPQEVLTCLNTMVEAGIDFDAIYVAHEIPKHVPRERWEEAILPAPCPKVRRRLHTLERWMSRWWRVVTLTPVIRRIAAAVASAADLLAADPYTSLLPATRRADPILLGVLTDKPCKPDGHSMGMWFYLSHWHWPVQQE